MKMKIQLLGMITLFLIGHIGVVNADDRGKTLDALASDILQDISLGPSKTQKCSINPYIARAMGTSTCPVIQSACAKGIPKKTTTSCAIIPSTNPNDSASIKSILVGIFGPMAENMLSQIKPTSTVSTNIQNCSSQSNVGGIMIPELLAPGGTPYCFYKVDASDYGLPMFWNPGDQNVNLFKSGGPFHQVPMSEFIKPGNWECYEINIKVQAHCVVIPTKVKSILGHFGVGIK